MKLHKTPRNKCTDPFPNEALSDARAQLVAALHGNSVLLVAPEGQPFLLRLEQRLLQEMHDPDSVLPTILEAGAPMGVEEPIAYRKDVWPAARYLLLDDLPPLIPAETNYSSFEEHNDAVRHIFREDAMDG